jgi:hypothetical protein
MAIATSARQDGFAGLGAKESHNVLYNKRLLPSKAGQVVISFLAMT